MITRKLRKSLLIKNPLFLQLSKTRKKSPTKIALRNVNPILKRAESQNLALNPRVNPLKEALNQGRKRNLSVLKTKIKM